MIREHTRTTEFKLESVELDIEQVIPLGMQLERDRKTVKVFYSQGDKAKLMLPKESD